MNKKIKYSITVGNRKYIYFLTKINNKTTLVECKDANIGQNFLDEDVPALLIDLPNLILAEKNYKNKQEEIIRFRISAKDKKTIEKRAMENGYVSISGFLRDLALGVK